MAQQRAIVIGTGFGGAVSSCRLAQAGFEVTVLERGRRYDGSPSGFPRGQPAEWLWSASHGLFDVRAVSEVQVVQSAGYGGGSLIYANVHLRAPAEVFDGAWPDGYSRASLDPYYDLVAYMLDIQPVDRAPDGAPPRAERMAQAAAALGREAQFIQPPLAVDFGPRDELRPNKFGVPQKGCIQCGECIIGCDKRAKNTLDFNYLAVAEQHGARMLTECEASRIEPRGEGLRGYRVHYHDHRAGEDRELTADQVFVCAGAINSTELLLRSRAGGALPRVSDRLGEHYSGNGDLLAAAFDTDPPVEADRGPTINTALLYASNDGPARGWFLIEDGGFPRSIWPLVAHLRPLLSGMAPTDGEAPPAVGSEVAAGLRRAAEAGMPPPPGGFVDASAMAATNVFLAMGLDRANGRIALLANGDIALQWDVPSNLPLYSLEARLMRDISRELHGTYRANPFWTCLRHPVTVHSLGGCPMGRSEAEGVVDAHGEVFHYPDLFVLDGAILPCATGVNPAHTIAAVAERNVEHIIRRTLGDPEWEAPERALAPPFTDPLDRVAAGATTTPPETPAVGLTFRERLSGSWERAGSAGAVRCALRITIDDIDRFLADPAHVGIVTGTITVAGLTGDEGVEVRNGVWNLFVASGTGPEQEMRYALPFHGADGILYALRGTKVFRPRPGLRLWAENTTLDFHIGLESDDGAPPLGRGVLRIGPADVLSLAASLEATGAPNPGVARRAVLDFLGFYRERLKEISRAA